jgi:catechol 2,3-dioxygenase-like lactoylglutathione lyase family enzyme
MVGGTNQGASMQLRYVILYVADVPATMDFYARAFGLETRFLHEGGDYGEMATGETRLAFSAISLMESPPPCGARLRQGPRRCRMPRRCPGARPLPMSVPPRAP